MHKKQKGYIAELAVAKNLAEQGFAVLLPYGENQRYDLVAEQAGRFWRIQVKYSTPKRGALRVNCQSSNNWSVKKYTADEIDLMAVYDALSGEIYFLEMTDLTDSNLMLRVAPSMNHQEKFIHYTAEFTRFPY